MKNLEIGTIINLEIIEKLKENFIKEIASSLAISIERPFNYYTMNKKGKKKYLCDESYSFTPNKGDYFEFNNVKYEIVSITHYYGSRSTGEIIVKKIK